MTYTADNIVGKTLFAARRVQLKAQPFDASPNVQTVEPGAAVGRVWSYLQPGPGRSTLYWMFEDGRGGYLYAPHNAKDFDTEQLESQFEKEQDAAWYESILPGKQTDPLGLSPQVGKVVNTITVVSIAAIIITLIPRILPKR